MEKNKPEGIRGWLLIPTFAFIVTAIISIYIIFLSLPFLYDGIILTTFLLTVGGLFLIVYILILEFQYKKEFSKWAIITLWYGFFEIIIISLMTPNYLRVLGGGVGAILWTWYFRKSKRVKNTFVN